MKYQRLKFIDPNADVGLAELAQIIFQHEMQQPEAVEMFRKLIECPNQKTVFVTAFTAGVAAALRAVENGKMRTVGRG
jgi:aspartate carbamoyltransferase regulatory subunit